MSQNVQTALITGGNGNIGRRVAERLLARGQRVVRCDIPGTEPAAVAVNETVITGDIRDLERLRSLLRDDKPDTIYHLASLLSGSSEIDLEQSWAINATASFNLMNLARETGVDKFFFASTAAERSSLTRQAYNLNGYYLSAEMVADAAKARYADFAYDFVPVESVERLIAGWPDVADDSDARRDRGWRPKYDFERTMTRVIELLNRERE